MEKSTSVHTFVDASNDAYGVASYLRCEFDQGITVSIIVSKRNVAHLKPMTTPRLELMAAILGLNLTLSIIESLSIPIADEHFWSDSMHVSYWICGGGRQFPPFVANRIGEIQRQSSPERRHYIKSVENSANVCSSGLRARSLLESQIWWNGSQFLLKAENDCCERRLWNQFNWCRKRASGVDELDHSQIQDQTASKGVKWSFDSPLAPHFGGVHEVMIKSPKNA